MKNNKFVNWEKYDENVIGPQTSRVTFSDGHVGGCNIYGDPATECPKMWKHLVDNFGIKSVIDVGCGFGFHTKYFKEILNCEVLGIEGSSKVVEISLLPNEIIHHDYTTGPYIPQKIYDLCWSVEFVEHVDQQYKQNFIETFKRCKYVAMTHGLPGQGGYHHVNCQPPEYWIKELTKNGFIHAEEVQKKCRELARVDFDDYNLWRTLSSDKPYRGPAAEASDNRVDIKTCKFDPFIVDNLLFFRNESYT